jgi:hypothetical protein
MQHSKGNQERETKEHEPRPGNNRQSEHAQDLAVTRRRFLEIAAGTSLSLSFPAYAGAEAVKGEVSTDQTMPDCFLTFSTARRNYKT